MPFTLAPNRSHPPLYTTCIYAQSQDKTRQVTHSQTTLFYTISLSAAAVYDWPAAAYYLTAYRTPPQVDESHKTLATTDIHITNSPKDQDNQARPTVHNLTHSVHKLYNYYIVSSNIVTLQISVDYI